MRPKTVEPSAGGTVANKFSSVRDGVRTARETAPQRVCLSVGRPQQPGRGLVLKRRERVLLQFAAQDQRQLVRRQRNFVLNKLIGNILASFGRLDARREGIFAGTLAVQVTITCSTSDFLTLRQGETVLKLDVEGFEHVRCSGPCCRGGSCRNRFAPTSRCLHRQYGGIVRRHCRPYCGRSPPPARNKAARFV